MPHESPTKLPHMMSNLQVSLNTFVGASEQAVAQLSPQEKSSSPNGFLGRFKGLTTELRRKIYEEVFRDAKLIVPWTEIATTVSGRTKIRCLSIDEIIQKIDFHQAALLSAVGWCKIEATLLLASHTTVEFTGLSTWNNEHVNILEAVDATFLKFVKKVEMPPISFIRCDRDALPKLTEVCLTHCMLNELEEDDFSPLLDHLLNCGDNDLTHPAQYAYRDYLEGSCDFQWKRKQILQLSEEHGYNVRFVARWYPQPQHRVWFEVEFEKGAPKVSKQGGVMRTSSGEMTGIENVEALQSLGLVNTWCYICSL